MNFRDKPYATVRDLCGVFLADHPPDVLVVWSVASHEVQNRFPRLTVFATAPYHDWIAVRTKVPV